MIDCLITNDNLELSTLREISGKYSTKLMSFNDILSVSCFQNSEHQISWVYNKTNIPSHFLEYELIHVDSF